MIEFKVPTERDIKKVQALASRFSKDEIKPWGSLDQHVKRATFCWAIFINQKLVGFVGGMQESLLDNKLYIWMIVTKHVSKFPKSFIRASRKFLDMLEKEYKFFRVFVRAENKKSVDWLQWLGFKPNGLIEIHGIETLILTKEN